MSNRILRGLGAAGLAAALSTSPQAGDAELRAKQAQSIESAVFAVGTRGERPRYTVTLASGRLDDMPELSVREGECITATKITVGEHLTDAYEAGIAVDYGARSKQDGQVSKTVDRIFQVGEPMCPEDLGYGLGDAIFSYALAEKGKEVRAAAPVPARMAGKRTGRRTGKPAKSAPRSHQPSNADTGSITVNGDDNIIVTGNTDTNVYLHRMEIADAEARRVLGMADAPTREVVRERVVNRPVYVGRPLGFAPAPFFRPWGYGYVGPRCFTVTTFHRGPAPRFYRGHAVRTRR